jgi:hypothetical protein
MVVAGATFRDIGPGAIYNAHRKDNIRQFPPCTLTMQALDDADSWEAALSLPLPKSPDIELLNRECSEVLIYLDFVTNDLAQGGDVSA